MLLAICVCIVVISLMLHGLQLYLLRNPTWPRSFPQHAHGGPVVLIVIAHPDDECMFFTPAITVPIPSLSSPFLSPFQLFFWSSGLLYYFSLVLPFAPFLFDSFHF